MIAQPGVRLGPYEILSAIGTGGMGEVYRARDTRLDRTVAIKMLRAAQADFGPRFAREAKAIAALSHPHICTLYDIGHEAGTDFLVMECLEGETLAARLERGAMPVAEALKTAIEIGSALDRAHRAGIVHRDVKPSNVMLTKAGSKLLDFGLAKFQTAPHDGGMTAAVTQSLSGAGVLTGTVPYMAPEQLEGREADARSDLFAFGAVLYEMVGGRRAFPGDSQASVIAAILERDPPPISTLQPRTPRALDRVVKKCLAKDPEDRWQTARDLVDELKWNADIATSTDATVASQPRWTPSAWKTLIAFAAAGLGVTAVLATIVGRLNSAGPMRSGGAPARFEIAPPVGTAFGMIPASPGLGANAETTSFSLSPDGSKLAFMATEPSGRTAIWLRPLSALAARLVPGTEDARSLFWSPDSQSIAFVSGGKLRRLDLAGGPAVPLCDLPGGAEIGGIPGSWGSADILFAPLGGKILRVSTSGGPPTTQLEPSSSGGETSVGWPWFLPDGRRFFYLAKRSDRDGRLMLADPGKPPVMVLSAISNMQWVDPDYVIFAREGTLLGQRIDLASGHIVGEPFAIAESVQYNRGTARAAFSVSRTGVLAYQAHTDLAELVRFDRSGREVGPIGPQGDYLSMRISRDGQRTIFARWDSQAGNYVVWKFDFDRALETRVTAERRGEMGGVWMPDGTGVFFSVQGGGSPHVVYKDLRTGAEKSLLPATALTGPQDVSPDGRLLAFFQRGAAATDLWTMPVDAMHAPSLFFARAFDARFSPDGRFVAFVSDESRPEEVYVAPSSPSAERTRVSNGGASMPRWSADGRELIYRTADRQIVSVAVRTGKSPTIELGTPVPLFAVKGKWPWREFDLLPDGRFLAIVPRLMANEQPLTVVLNWTAEVRR